MASSTFIIYYFHVLRIFTFFYKIEGSSTNYLILSLDVDTYIKLSLYSVNMHTQAPHLYMGQAGDTGGKNETKNVY